MTQAFNLSQLANNLNSTGQLDATDGLVNAVPVANGGTGANSVAGARTNLGLDYQTIAAQIYPVGSIYSSTVSTNPNTLLGFGTWVAYAAGRVMVGNGGGFSAGATGGSADAIVVSHSHTTTVTDPGHNHSLYRSDAGGSINDTPNNQYPGKTYNDYVQDAIPNAGRSGASTTGVGVSISSTGSSGANANLPPYIVVYMWARTA